MGPSTEDRPSHPWVPATCSVRPVVRGTSRTRARAGMPAKERPVWDVHWSVDGLRYFKRFDRAGDAEEHARDLRAGHARRWPFDPVAKRFDRPDRVALVAPTDGTEPERDEAPTPAGLETVFTWTQRYWDRKWPTIEPKGRRELARYLNRARRSLVDQPPPDDLSGVVDAYLGSHSLTVSEQEPTDETAEGEAWLSAHSLPLTAVGRVELDRLVTTYSVHQRDPSRQVSAASLRRMVADLRQCWARAVHDEVIPTNPWEKVRLDDRTKGRDSRSSAPLAADAELVLSPAQVWELADACVTEGSWGSSVRAFVLVMGFCGLRPSEACGVVVGDLELPETGTGWLTVRRSRRTVDGRYLAPDDDPDWGPLKGRQLAETRRVPIPPLVAEALRAHLEQHCAGARPVDLVFQHRGKPFDLANHQRDVWQPARAHLFPLVEHIPADSPLQPKLSRLRRHDLRHSACSMWLAAGVDVTVCQKWSGHQQLSAFLDIYQGLIPGREEEGVRRLAAMLGASTASCDSRPAHEPR